MSLRSKFFSGVAVAVAATAFSVAGIAQEKVERSPEAGQKKERMRGEGFGKGMRDGHGKGMRGGKHGGFGLRGIELTEAQKEQLKAIREANKPDPAIREEMKTIMMARRDGTITEEQKTRVQTLRAQQMEKAQAVRAQVDAILTPEQKQQIETRKQEMRQKMEERRQQWQQRREEFKQRKEAGETKPAEKPAI